MLDIIRDPRAAPSVLGKRVHAAPSCNDQAIEEFLGPPSALQPGLPDQKHDGHDDAVADEGGTHDEMCETLAQMVVTAVSKCCDSSKEHLYPGDDRHGFTNHAMAEYSNAANEYVDSLGEVKLQVDAESDLHGKEEHEPVCEFGMYVRGELAAFVGVSEKVGYDCYYCADDLHGDVPAVLDDLRGHQLKFWR
jgi:hypothetical protein